MPHPLNEISPCLVVNERNRLLKSARCVSLALLHIHGLLDGFWNYSVWITQASIAWVYHVSRKFRVGKLWELKKEFQVFCVLWLVAVSFLLQPEKKTRKVNILVILSIKALHEPYFTSDPIFGVPGNDRVLGIGVVRGPLPPYHRWRPPPHQSLTLQWLHQNICNKTEVKVVFVSETSMLQIKENLLT